MVVHEHNIATDAGDGSGSEIDEKYDGEEYPSKDKRANTRTTFYRSDIEDLDCSRERKERLKRILRRQEGENQGETYFEERPDRHQQNREEWKRRLVSTYSSQLGMNRHQRERTEHIVMDVLDINSFGPYTTESVILSVVYVVGREDGREVESHPQFDSLTEEDVSPSTIERIAEMVAERVPSMRDEDN